MSTQRVQGVLLFLVLAVNSARVLILLQPPILTCVHLWHTFEGGVVERHFVGHNTHTYLKAVRYMCASYLESDVCT